MTGKAKIIFPLVMAMIMAFIMSGILTLVYRGLQPDFLILWIRAYLIAWPCASVAVFVAIPIAQKITIKLVKILETEKA